jgi:hypothetical protein
MINICEPRRAILILRLYNKFLILAYKNQCLKYKMHNNGERLIYGMNNVIKC